MHQSTQLATAMTRGKCFKAFCAGLATVLAAVLLSVATPRPAHSLTASDVFNNDPLLTSVIKVTVSGTGLATPLKQTLSSDQFQTMSLSSWGSPSMHGCRTIKVTYSYGRNYLGLLTLTYYRFNASVYWCYDHPTGRVGTHNAHAYFDRVDSIWYPQGNSADYCGTHYYYQWIQQWYAPRSGWYVRCSAQIKNIVLKYGEIGNHNPWAKIYVHSNGTASWDAGR